jgi:hypothetical protein
MRFLTKSLSTLLNAAQTNWDEILDECLFVYRSSVSRVLDDSPFYMIYGRDPVLPQDLLIPVKIRQPETEVDFKMERLKQLKRAHENLQARKVIYQQRYKLEYDKVHKDVKFEVGDSVMVYFPASKIGMSYKFLPKWEGPFKVTAKISPLNYRVESTKLNKTFVVHVQRLLRYRPWNTIDN